MVLWYNVYRGKFHDKNQTAKNGKYKGCDSDAEIKYTNTHGDFFKHTKMRSVCSKANRFGH